MSPTRPHGAPPGRDSLRQRIGSPRPARLLRFGFLLLLVAAVAQVLWWELDQTRYARRIEEERLRSFRSDAAAAEELLRRGASPAEVEARWPHLGARVSEGSEPAVAVRESAREMLRRERRRHLNQYHWEGAFFLLVLLAGIGVLWRVLHQEAELRRRQQNFLAAVSHELKSPIASLQLATETMARRPLDDARRAELLGRNLKDLDRLQRLVANLLAVPRLESGRMELERARVELAPAVAEVLADLEAAGFAAARGVEVRVPAGLAVEADPVGVATVLRNLIENALLATEEGGTVRVEAHRDRGGVWLSVADEGVGFDPAEARRLFEMFYRPGDEMRRRSRGTGLGLYLVQRFVQLEGGAVRAASDGPGRGARFDVLWPVRTRGVGMSRAGADPAVVRGPRVLVVEDEEHLAAGIAENLELEGHSVEIASDGLTALQRLLAEHFDLVILDVMLPRLDGFAVCRLARERGVDTPVLFLTARGGAPDRIQGLRAGGDDYLAKPFHLEELLLRVRAILRRARAVPVEEPELASPVVEFGGNRVDLKAYRARSFDGVEHELTHKEAQILRLLVARAGEVVSRDDILDRVWGHEEFPTARTIDNFVLRLRRRFERTPEEPRHFHTVRGVGYRFTRDAES